jgi:hypothetical protein
VNRRSRTRETQGEAEAFGSSASDHSNRTRHVLAILTYTDVGQAILPAGLQQANCPCEDPGLAEEPSSKAAAEEVARPAGRAVMDCPVALNRPVRRASKDVDNHSTWLQSAGQRSVDLATRKEQRIRRLTVER